MNFWWEWKKGRQEGEESFQSGFSFFLLLSCFVRSYLQLPCGNITVFDPGYQFQVCLFIYFVLFFMLCDIIPLCIAYFVRDTFSTFDNLSSILYINQRWIKGSCCGSGLIQLLAHNYSFVIKFFFRLSLGLLKGLQISSSTLINIIVKVLSPNVCDKYAILG